MLLIDSIEMPLIDHEPTSMPLDHHKIHDAWQGNVPTQCNQFQVIYDSLYQSLLH